MKNTNKALFSSVIALILCCSMLIGSTFAWFTDEAASGVNQIVAGNLEVDALVDGNSIDGMDTLFNDVANWEPGVVAYENLTVVNKGNLALKYELSINFANENTLGGVGLSDVLQVAVVTDGVDTTLTRDELIASISNEDWEDLDSFNLYGKLENKDDATTYGIVIYWAPGADDNNWNVNNGKEVSDFAQTGVNALHIDLGVHLYATQLANEDDSFGNDYDEDAYVVDVSWYNDTDTEFVLSNAAELRGLAALVNGTAPVGATTYSLRSTPAATVAPVSFAGKTIKLDADIDLRNAEWTPIGNWDNTFEGTFDGQKHTISNLCINDPEGEGIGLFGVVANAVIKDVTLHNVEVNAYSMVAGLVGAAYPANISGCHITGDVEIVAEWAYVAGIAGYCYYGTQVDNCSVVAEGTGLIQSVTRNAVGGITAWLLEGNHNVTKCTVKNLNLVGWTNVGGITGFVHYNNTIDGCSVENVTLTKTRVDGNPGIGLIAGGWSYSASNAIKLSNNTAKNASLNGTHIAYSAYNELYGSEYGGATTSNFVLENNTIENITNNLVVIQVIKTADDLKAALTNGGTNYVLTADIAVTEVLAVPAGVTVTLDLNGHTIAGSFSNSGNQEMFLVKGNLTVKDGTFKMTAANNQGWNAMATIFDVTAGGALTMDGVTASVSGTDMNFIVHLNNWGTASATITNCDFNLSYVAVRAFNSGYDMNTVTIKNTDVTGGARLFWVHNYTAEGKDDSTLTLDIYGNGNTCENAKPVRFGFNDSVYYNLEGKLLVTVTSADALKDAAQGGNVVIDATGVVVEGKSGLNYPDATIIGATFKNEGGQAVSGTVAGTYKNCVFEGNETLRWCYTEAGETLVFENCVFKTDFRGIHFDGMDGNVIFKNCVINGFNAYSGSGTMTFEGCTFGYDDSSYNGLNIYSNTVLINCTFNYVSGKTNFIDMEGTGKTLTITGCTATLDGVAADVADFVGGSKLAQNTVIIDGVTQ